jgi:hypothetical protein
MTEAVGGYLWTKAGCRTAARARWVTAEIDERRIDITTGFGNVDRGLSDRSIVPAYNWFTGGLDTPVLQDGSWTRGTLRTLDYCHGATMPPEPVWESSSIKVPTPAARFAGRDYALTQALAAPVNGCYWARRRPSVGRTPPPLPSDEHGVVYPIQHFASKGIGHRLKMPRATAVLRQKTR